MTDAKHVVIVGGGFAGLGCARKLAGRDDIRVTLIDKHNFMFIPHYPFWALLVIALDVFVIWALAAHGRELRDTSA